MVEGQERVLFVGDDFQEGVAEERLVEGQLAAYLPQGFARSIDLRDEGAQQGDFRIEREAFAGDVVGLVVDDAAVRGRAARHKGQGCGEEIVVAPAPEFVAFDPCGAEREVGVVAADGLHQRRFLEFLFRVHGYWFDLAYKQSAVKDGILTLGKEVNIDFSKIENGDIQGVSKIDLGVEGKNELLNLTLQDVMDIGKKDGGNINLTILGDSQDKVSFKDEIGKTWEKQANSVTENNKTFDVYTNSGDPTVQVKVEEKISDGITS